MEAAVTELPLLHPCLSLSSFFFLESNTFAFSNHKHEIEDEISSPKINSVLLAAVKTVEINIILQPRIPHKGHNKRLISIQR